MRTVWRGCSGGGVSAVEQSCRRPCQCGTVVQGYSPLQSRRRRIGERVGAERLGAPPGKLRSLLPPLGAATVPDRRTARTVPSFITLTSRNTSRSCLTCTALRSRIKGVRLAGACGRPLANAMSSSCQATSPWYCRLLTSFTANRGGFRC